MSRAGVSGRSANNHRRLETGPCSAAVLSPLAAASAGTARQLVMTRWVHKMRAERVRDSIPRYPTS
jgi:hypothetical protein